MADDLKHSEKAPPQPAAAESVIYQGRAAVGTVLVVRKGQVTALDAAGKRLGTFATDREAMRAVLEAAKKSEGA
jgi:hypothetical protein